jgi:hypothetical protein
MALIDPEQERKRLTEFYAGQMDGELEKVASQAHELSDIAREVLRAELARRGLEIGLTEQARVAANAPPEPRPGDPPTKPEAYEDASLLDGGEIEFRMIVTIRQFRDLPEALLAKGCLDSAGIDSVLVDENLIRLDWFWSNGMGGVKLKVEPADAAEAEELLNQPIPEKFDVAGIGEYEQPQCPNCKSLEVTFKELNRPISYMTMWLNVPIPIHRRAWRCHSCNVEWEDDGLPAPADSSG